MGITPFPGPLGRLRNAVLARLTGRLFAPTNKLADDMFRDLHDRPAPFPVLDWPRSAEAIVQFTVTEFEYPRSDAPATLHFAGPLSASGSQAPLPTWWPELDGSRPVVHVTQSLPANARAAEFLPYDELLPRTGVYVTNSGYGGVQYALRYGVPIVATSGHEDKAEVAARVAWSGVGRRLNTETPSPAAVRRAVHTVLRDERYRTTAQHIAQRMAATDELKQLTEIVDNQIANNAQPQNP